MTPVRIPGLDGVLHAMPQGSAEGGDLYYLSACGSGALARICLADARGHGAAAAAFSAALEQVFQAQIHNASPATVLAQVNRRTVTGNFDLVSTALCMSYNSLNGQLRFASAGHPHARVCRRGEAVWRPLTAEDRGRALANIPLGVSREACYLDGKDRLQPGDRLILHTDGLSEARDASGVLLGHTLWDGTIPIEDGVRPMDQANAILQALRTHTGRELASHDDITFAILEAGPYQRSNRYALLVRNNWRRFVNWASQRG
jgi:serine phosphatase RsbU (regulator of sigma subunit)